MSQTVSKESERFDDYLARNDKWRKAIPGDSSSLFRAVAEEIFSAQQYHEQVRNDCVNYLQQNKSFYQQFVVSVKEFESCVSALRQHETLCNVELVFNALAKVYKCDIHVYEAPEQPAQLVGKGSDDVTDENLKQVYLYCTGEDRYDLILPKSQYCSLAFVQSLVYEEVLYKGVFGVTDLVTEAQRTLQAPRAGVTSQR